jgi:hypothetical protein
MRILSTLAAVAVLATAPLTSHAQSRPGDDHNTHNHPDKAQAAPAAPGGMDMKGGMSRMMAMMHGGMMGDMPLKHVEGRLAFLKTELKITPAQESQWARFADVVRSTARTAQAAKPPMMKPSTAPDRLGHYEKTLAVRLETVRALKTAVDPLYASFSDEQKKLADELLMSPMGIM